MQLTEGSMLALRPKYQHSSQIENDVLTNVQNPFEGVKDIMEIMADK